MTTSHTLNALFQSELNTNLNLDDVIRFINDRMDQLPIKPSPESCAELLEDSDLYKIFGERVIDNVPNDVLIDVLVGRLQEWEVIIQVMASCDTRSKLVTSMIDFDGLFDMETLVSQIPTEHLENYLEMRHETKS